MSKAASKTTEKVDESKSPKKKEDGVKGKEGVKPADKGKDKEEKKDKDKDEKKKDDKKTPEDAKAPRAEEGKKMAEEVKGVEPEKDAKKITYADLFDPDDPLTQAKEMVLQNAAEILHESDVKEAEKVYKASDRDDQAKFDYSIALVRAKHAAEINVGLQNLKVVYGSLQRNAEAGEGADPNMARACLYYIAFGSFRLMKFDAAVTYSQVLLNENTANMPAKAIIALCRDMVRYPKVFSGFMKTDKKESLISPRKGLPDHGSGTTDQQNKTMAKLKKKQEEERLKLEEERTKKKKKEDEEFKKLRAKDKKEEAKQQEKDLKKKEEIKQKRREVEDSVLHANKGAKAKQEEDTVPSWVDELAAEIDQDDPNKTKVVALPGMGGGQLPANHVVKAAPKEEKPTQKEEKKADDGKKTDDVKKGVEMKEEAKKGGELPVRRTVEHEEDLPKKNKAGKEGAKKGEDVKAAGGLKSERSTKSKEENFQKKPDESTEGKSTLPVSSPRASERERPMRKDRSANSVPELKKERSSTNLPRDKSLADLKKEMSNPTLAGDNSDMSPRATPREQINAIDIDELIAKAAAPKSAEDEESLSFLRSGMGDFQNEFSSLFGIEGINLNAPRKSAEEEHEESGFYRDEDGMLVRTVHEAPSSAPVQAGAAPRSESVMSVLNQLYAPPPASKVERWVVLRRFGKRGGKKVQIPPHMDELLAEATIRFDVRIVAFREVDTEAEVDDIDGVTPDSVLLALTAEENAEFD